MKGSRKFWTVVLVLGIAGLTWLIVLLIRHGLADITAALAKAGWGVAAVVAFHFVVLVCNALAWHCVFPPGQRLPFTKLLWIRWMGESVQNLFPATAVGGEVVRARLAVTQGVPGALAAASVITDITLGMFAQTLFTITGVYLLARYTGRAGMATHAIVGTMIALCAAGGFFAVQRFGLFRVIAGRVRKLASSEAFQSLAHHGQKLDAQVREAYARRAGAWGSFFWSLMNWITGVGEVWIAMIALGASGSFGKAWMVESIQQAVRAAAFVVPGGLGVQEESYLMLGSVAGISPETSLALAMIRRVRELAWGIPGVIAWQFAEGRHLLKSEAINATRK